uniref:Uncharacterized protein n=1 Tax=Anguilla anguilla TaxID=7936 RepID=A0A0E9SJ86_ANGAN
MLSPLTGSYVRGSGSLPKRSGGEPCSGTVRSVSGFRASFLLLII